MDRKSGRKLGSNLFLLTIVVCPLLLGGNRDWAFLSLGLMLCISLGLMRIFNKASSVKVSSHGTLRLVLMAAGATLLQVIPLPESFLKSLAPTNYEIISISLGEDFGWAPLTLDVSHSYHELLKLLAYLSAALCVLEYRKIYGGKKSRLTFLQVLGLSGTAVFFMGCLHVLLGYNSTFNSFENSTSLFPSTFVNPNHLAAFFSLTAMCNLSVYLILNQYNRTAWPWGINCLVMILGNFLTLSRAGIISLMLVTTALGICFAARRLAPASVKPIAVGVTVLPLGALLCATLFIGDRFFRELNSVFQSSSLAKTEIWQAFPQMLNDFSLFGIGRGAFSAIFPKYSPVTDSHTFSHFENEWIQTLVDWGLIFGPLIIILLLVTSITVYRNHRSDNAIWPIFAIFPCLGMHNVMDFNLAIMGIAMPLVILLTLLGPSPKLSQRKKKFQSYGQPLLLGLSIAFLATQSLGHSLTKDCSELYEATLEPNRSPSETLARINEAIKRHPGDYYLHSLKAQTMLRDKASPKNVLATVNASLYLAPNRPETHILAGHTLYKMGIIGQAFTEYRIALQKSPGLLPQIADDIARQTGDIANIRKLAGFDAESKIQVAQILKNKGKHELAIEILEDHLETDTNILVILCDTQYENKNYEDAVQTAQRLRQYAPSWHYGYLWGAQALAHLDRREEARVIIEEGLKRFGTNLYILKAAAEFYLSRNERIQTRRLLKTLQTLSPDSEHRAWIRYCEAQLYQGENRPLDAIKSLESAYSLNPTEYNYIREAVDLRLELKDQPGAIRLLEKAIGKSPLHLNQLKEQLARLKNANQVFSGEPEPSVTASP